MRLSALLIFVALILSGCTREMVGSQCVWETNIGSAQIQWEQSGAQAHFSPTREGFKQSIVRFSPDMEFEVNQPTDSERNDTYYPARLDLITEGSCTPYRFELLSSEYFSQGSFLPFDQNGKITIGAQKRLMQIAEVYQRLSPQWPNLVVKLCGQTDREGMADYNLELASRYAEQISINLKGLKVPAGALHLSAAGSESCPRGNLHFDEVEHGVWVSFLLTGVDQLGQADILLAEDGDKQAQEKILNLVNLQTTSSPDKKRASQWLKIAAQGPNPEVQYALGVAYLWGNGVAVNRTRGVEWIRTAAYNDFPPAQRELGLMYYHGDIIEQDLARSYAWFLIAAENGDTEAQHEVLEYEKHVKTALEYSAEDLKAGKAISQSLKMTIKPTKPL